MQAIILLGLLGLLAAAARMMEKRVRQQAESSEPLEPACTEETPAAAAARLAQVVDGLRAVMAHPQLGGPGFLTVAFPAYGQPEVQAQYPNIQEVLYRRIVRGELERAALVELGVPEEILEWGVEFETESGGMVLLHTETACLTPEARRLLVDHRGRGCFLRALAKALSEREPDLVVRLVGGEIMLMPQSKESPAAPPLRTGTQGLPGGGPAAERRCCRENREIPP